jgi:carbon monoxide dehydrogenase subunit G
MDVQVEETIARPREDVARFAMAPENETRWIGGIKESRMLTEPPLAVGSEVARVASFLGRRIDYALRVIEHEPGRIIVMDSVRGPFPMRVTYAFADDSAGGTRVRNRVEGEATGFYGLAAPLMSAAVRRSLRGDLRTLKRIMESPG